MSSSLHNKTKNRTVVHSFYLQYNAIFF